jgi:hypothetical protein
MRIRLSIEDYGFYSLKEFPPHVIGRCDGPDFWNRTFNSLVRWRSRNWSIIMVTIKLVKTIKEFASEPNTNICCNEIANQKRKDLAGDIATRLGICICV